MSEKISEFFESGLTIATSDRVKNKIISIAVKRTISKRQKSSAAFLQTSKIQKNSPTKNCCS